MVSHLFDIGELLFSKKRKKAIYFHRRELVPRFLGIQFYSIRCCIHWQYSSQETVLLNEIKSLIFKRYEGHLSSNWQYFFRFEGSPCVGETTYLSYLIHPNPSLAIIKLKCCKHEQIYLWRFSCFLLSMTNLHVKSRFKKKEEKSQHMWQSKIEFEIRTRFKCECYCRFEAHFFLHSNNFFFFPLLKQNFEEMLRNKKLNGEYLMTNVSFEVFLLRLRLL